MPQLELKPTQLKACPHLTVVTISRSPIATRDAPGGGSQASCDTVACIGPACQYWLNGPQGAEYGNCSPTATAIMQLELLLTMKQLLAAVSPPEPPQEQPPTT